MEDEGIIERYVAVLNPRALGMRLDVFVNVRLRSSTREAIEIFERAVKEMPEVVECYLVTGNYDYLVHIRVADIDDFKGYVRERLSAIASVGETISSIALEQTKHTTAIALPSSTKLETSADDTAVATGAVAKREFLSFSHTTTSFKCKRFAARPQHRRRAPPAAAKHRLGSRLIRASGRRPGESLSRLVMLMYGPPQDCKGKLRTRRQVCVNVFGL